MPLLLYGCAAPNLAPKTVANGVRFSIRLPEAKSVAIAGSFNHWHTDDVLSGPDESGAWTITLPLEAGRYEYLFFINGETWMTDPSVPTTDDGLGGKNSVIHIGP